ncbi:DnaB-like helicase C-terminal domain-containing protein (plasmid) [Borreliella americana]|uniref:DnaB-like helicase C-terminal domain-containing protein n=1 Tax=Borreliella americana TaxID=478807 RepID=A0ACD5G836_9SPIR
MKIIKNNLIESGFKSLDKIIQGFNKSDFVIIEARPSVSKTLPLHLL